MKKINLMIPTIIFFTIICIGGLTVSATDSTEKNDPWDSMLYFNSGDTYNIAYFGESTDASDGIDSIDIDASYIPASPSQSSKISAWFNIQSDTEYKLWKDYKQCPDTLKTWDLSIQWIPSDYTSSTEITIFWYTEDMMNIYYDTAIIFDVENQENVADLLVDTEYTFDIDALEIHEFQIICQINEDQNQDETENEDEEENNNEDVETPPNTRQETETPPDNTETNDNNLDETTKDETKKQESDNKPEKPTPYDADIENIVKRDVIINSELNTNQNSKSNENIVIANNTPGYQTYLVIFSLCLVFIILRRKSQQKKH